MIRPARRAGGFVVAALLASLLVVAASAPGAATSKPKVLLLGDSVIEMICKYAPGELDGLRQVFDVTCDGRDIAPFRTTSTGPELIRGNADNFDDHLVIALGYNDGTNASAFAAAARQVMEMPEVKAVPHVFWLTLRDVDGSYRGANDVLRGLASEHPNLTLLDWHGVSIAEPRVMTRSDGVHLTNAGADAMANMIETALRRTVDQDGARRQCRAPSASVDPAPDPASGRGYYLLDSSGVVHAYGDAPLHGDVRGGSSPPVSMQTTAAGDGYWIVTADGRVHAFGGADHHGDMPSRHPGLELDGPVRRIEPHPRAAGYWLMAADGGIFTFGPGADFHGSVPGVLPPGSRLLGEIISITATASGDGYFLVGEDGGVFTFGGARFLGSVYKYLPPGRQLDRPVISLAVHPAGTGYWLYAEDGGIFSFGGVGFYGSVPGLGLCTLPEAVSMRPTATGNGYWVVTVEGWVIPFGDAADHGGEPDLPPGVEVIDMAIRR